MTARKCPECLEPLPPGGNSVKFDNEHNVICGKCNGIVIAAIVAKERKIIVSSIVAPYHKGYAYPGYDQYD